MKYSSVGFFSVQNSMNNLISFKTIFIFYGIYFSLVDYLINRTCSNARRKYFSVPKTRTLCELFVFIAVGLLICQTNITPRTEDPLGKNLSFLTVSFQCFVYNTITVRNTFCKLCTKSHNWQWIFSHRIVRPSSL